MNVQAGDVIRVIEGSHGRKHRLGKVLRVEGTPGHEQLHVHWEDDHQSLIFLGEGVEILHHADPHGDVFANRHTQGWGPLWD